MLTIYIYYYIFIFRYRALYDVIDMPWDWPVDVNYHEAKAFCSWKGSDYRLPTEAEHYRMRGDGVSSCIMFKGTILNFSLGLDFSLLPWIRTVIHATEVTTLPIST